jgi:hypothetical protein
LATNLAEQADSSIVPGLSRRNYVLHKVHLGSHGQCLCQTKRKEQVQTLGRSLDRPSRFYLGLPS